MVNPGDVTRVPLGSTVGGAGSIPIVGLGTWQSKPGEVAAAVETCIDAGYRHLDCAYAYQNEQEVGNGIQAKLKDRTIKRGDLFVTTKLWNTFHSGNLVRGICMEQLKMLQLDSVDLYLIHWPHGFEEGGDRFPKNPDGSMRYSDVDYLETWTAMESLVDEGLVKNIGLSNFNHEQIERVLKIARIHPAMLQVEANIYFQNRKLQKFCEGKGIPMTAYSPLGSPGSNSGDAVNKPLEDPVVKELAAKYNKTEGQILLRFLVQRGLVVIPKSVTPERIRSNLDLFDFSFTEEDMQKLFALDKNLRSITLDRDKGHKHFPFNAEY